MRPRVPESIRLLAMPCRRHTELISCGLDGPLPAGVRAALWTHMVLCVRCRNFARQARFLSRAVRRLGERGVGPGAAGMPAEVRLRLEQRLADL